MGVNEVSGEETKSMFPSPIQQVNLRFVQANQTCPLFKSSLITKILHSDQIGQAQSRQPRTYPAPLYVNLLLYNLSNGQNDPEHFSI